MANLNYSRWSQKIGILFTLTAKTYCSKYIDDIIGSKCNNTALGMKKKFDNEWFVSVSNLTNNKSVTIRIFLLAS